MLKLLLLVALWGTSFSNPVSVFNDNLNDMWAQYKSAHGKTYDSPAEETLRRFTWEQNVAYIQQHNLEADMNMHTFHLGINAHADLTDDEYKKYFLGYRMRNRTEDAPVFLAPENVVIPSTMDWRDKGYVTPIKDQARCGSCWAFSATGALEGQHFKRTKKLVSLSEQNLVDCSKKQGNHGCEGGTMNMAFSYIKMNGGIDTEESYPYMAKDGTCEFKINDVGATDSGYSDITNFDEDALLKAVATVGPISVAIDASASDFRFYKTGVYTSTKCSSTRLDHGVLVVGYGMENGDDYWLVKNSWGLSWGDKGYIKMRRNHNNMCGIATDASYPLV